MENRSSVYQLTKHQKVYMVIKRILDFVIALLSLIILSVPMILIVIVSKVSDRNHKAIFSQDRVGKDGRVFRIYKFRTLKNIDKYVSARNIDYKAYSDKWGQFLRKSSLDELPQLFNILKGEMSLIGPRPLIPNEKTAHELRNEKGIYQIYPGIAGLAQAKGRNSLDEVGKVNLDYEYLKNYSFIEDLKIAGFTVIRVLGRKDI